MSDWSIDQARETYSMSYWGGGYFDINEQGHVAATPDPERRESSIDLYQLTQEIHEAGLSLPVLVRFPDILHNRIKTLCGSFREAMQAHEYRGRYTAVYPIKVNQQRSVVEQILERSEACVGLEAGSKPELMAVLALSSQDHPIVICNGYKDREYIRLALIGQKLGQQVYIVIEKLSELELVIREARDLGIQPLLGMRVRLSSLGAGKWQNTGGVKSKFGLHASQILKMVERLKEVDMLDCLQLMHFHMGSQISNIRDIQKGMQEATRFYAELHGMGVDIQVVDVGGGLGVDYEGTRSRSFCSMNYSVQEYANNVVHALWEVCEQNRIEHPDIITESGRAMTAHHAVLITNVIDYEVVNDLAMGEPEDDSPTILQDMWNVLQAMDNRSVLEAYHDAAHWLNQAQEMCTHGVLSLEHRALAERLYYASCQKARSLLKPSVRSHRELLDELNDTLADKYFCNFSLFQSIPDVWAIKQIFPVVPLHRMNEEPQRRAVIQDLTCDSDGRIDFYVDQEGIETTLPVHSVQNGETYLLGMFMVGAYQEILGDMHNLFGDTDSVNVILKEDGSHELSQADQGDTVEEVLAYVHFDADDLLRRYREKVLQLNIEKEIRESYLDELEAGLRGYTYLED